MDLDTRFDFDLLSNSEKDSDSSSEDEVLSWKETMSLIDRHDIPADYWQMLKLVKFLKGGTPSSTAVVLGCINDFNLESNFMQLAVCEAKILELLVNLIVKSGGDVRCKKISLAILSRVTAHEVVQREVTNMGIIPLLVDLLKDPARDLQKLAASVIANVAELKVSRRQVRECGGIPDLVHLLDVEEKLLRCHKSKLSPDEMERLDVASNAAKALWSLSHCDVNKVHMHATGIIGLIPKLLQSWHKDIVFQTMGILQNCGNLPEFQMAIYTLDLVKDIVNLFSCRSVELKTLCALALFRHSDDEKIRSLVRKHNGLTPLVRILQQETTRENMDLLTAVTGAVWKLSISEDNVRHLDTVNTIGTLVSLLDVDDETVLVHVAGALAECGKLSHNAANIKRAGGITPLVALLNSTHQPLLANTIHVLGECAWDLDCMVEMEDHDAVRLIWSLLKNPSTKVQARAAWALVPCLRNANESGEMARSFVGGIELIVKRLHSSDSRVVGCTCAALAELATDYENLAVVSDLGVVPVLSRLCADVEDDQFLQEHLAAAVAACCNWKRNCQQFGRLGVVTPFVKFLYHSNERVQSTTIAALSRLSKNPFNCVALHQSGVVPLLIEAVGSTDLNKQRAAAKCLASIRKLALNADKYRLEKVKKKKVNSPSTLPERRITS